MRKANIQPRTSEDGFTFTEVIVYLFAFSLLVGISWKVFIPMYNNLEKVRSLGERMNQVQQLESYLRNEVNKIKIPYWYRFVESKDTSSLSLPYYQGEEGAILNLQAEEKGLRITTPESEYFFPLPKAEIAYWGEDVIYGISLFFVWRGEKEELFFPFGET